MIDSDSDSDVVEVVEFIGAKRRKLDAPNQLASSSRILKKHDRNPDVLRLTDVVSKSRVSEVVKSEDFETTRLAFGIPILLQATNGNFISDKGLRDCSDSQLRDALPSKQFQAYNNIIYNSIDLGRPGYLLNSGLGVPKAETSTVKRRLAIATPQIKAEDICVDIDLTLDDWETGDDEYQDTLTVEVGDDDTEILDDPLQPDDSISDPAMCSFCNRKLAKMTSTEIQLHLKGCSGQDCSRVSKSKGSQVKREANVSKPLQPISAIPPPSLPMPGLSELVSCGKRNGSDAFSVLMSSFKENEAWREATVAEDRNFRPSKSNGGRRKAPFYKVLQGMPIAVDAFKYGTIPGVNAYFLTHAHSDHYTNLSSNWKSGPIYCSEGTANLIVHMLSVDKKWVNPLPMDLPTTIPGTNGVKVTLIEANHCPGSCLFFFEGAQTVNAGDSTFKSPHVGSSRIFRYLHCGDFRASPRHVMHPIVKGKNIDHIYLDTTYLDPKYTFPPQPLVISACAELARRLESGQRVNEKIGTVDSWMDIPKEKGKGKEKVAERHILFVVGTYSIGKERIVKAVARALNSKIYCDGRKASILRCQADAELNSLLTSDPSDAIVHLLPLGMISSDKLKIYLERFSGKYAKVVGFRPTGWTYVQPSGTDQLPTVNAILTRSTQKTFTHEDLKISAKSSSLLRLYPVPYSEHSSFHELTCFAMSLNWGKMIATVNVGSEASRGKMAKWFARWEAERKRRGKDEVVTYRHIDYW